MTRPQIPAEFRSFAETVKQRVTTLERRLNRALDELTDTTTFTLPGSVSVSESGRLPFLGGKTAKTIAATLSTPGSDATVVELRRSGDQVATLTIPAGSTDATIGVTVAFGVSDWATVACTTAGGGATNLVVLVAWG